MLAEIEQLLAEPEVGEAEREDLKALERRVKLHRKGTEQRIREERVN